MANTILIARTILNKNFQILGLVLPYPKFDFML